MPCLRSGAYLEGADESREGELVSFRVTVIGAAPSGSVTLRDSGRLMLPLETMWNFRGQHRGDDRPRRQAAISCSRVGAYAFVFSGIPASAGVRFAFRALQV